LSRFVYGLSRVMTMSDVAELTLLSWDTVMGVVGKQRVFLAFDKPAVLAREPGIFTLAHLV
jgi:hypothetical protein